MAVFQTEFNYKLPRGYVDTEGTLHTTVTMRLATAADEITPMRDPRVQQNPSYLTILLLARVVTKIGTITNITSTMIENLFTVDLNFLQNMYEQINQAEPPVFRTTCPHCGMSFDVDVNFTTEA